MVHPWKNLIDQACNSKKNRCFFRKRNQLSHTLKCSFYDFNHSDKQGQYTFTFQFRFFLAPRYVLRGRNETFDQFFLGTEKNTGIKSYKKGLEPAQMTKMLQIEDLERAMKEITTEELSKRR